MTGNRPRELRVLRLGAMAIASLALSSLSIGIAVAGEQPNLQLAQSGSPTEDNAPKTTGPDTSVPAPSGAPHAGVLKPPPTGDAEMNKGVPPPSEFPTPVIPPPGTPGGNPAVVPK